MGLSVSDLSEGDVLLNYSNFDCHSFSFLSIGDDDDVSALNASNPITLFSDVFNFDFSALAFLYRWVWWTLVSLWLSFV